MKNAHICVYVIHYVALYFSLSTMATIGYGTSDYYFGECWTPFLLVLLQVIVAIIFSSLAIGLLFQRMSRGQKRGRTIVFSDVAVIRKVRGQWYFMLRVAELRQRHIIGAKIRVFCVRHERCPVATISGDVESGRANEAMVELETAHFVSHPLPLLNGSKQSTNNNTSMDNVDTAECSYEQSILMGLPHVVAHRMDALSPMIPPRPVWYDEGGIPHGPSVNNQTGEDMTPLVEEGQSLQNNMQQQPSQEEITHFLKDRQAEIICFLEGTCEVTGMALQARHSYRIEDVAFHQTFAPCVFPAPRYLEIDFTQFHDLLPAPYDSLSCPYIPSSALRKR